MSDKQWFVIIFGMLRLLIHAHSGKAVFQTNVCFFFFRVITSSGLEQQLWAVQRAHDAAERLGLSVTTWQWPATC